MKVSLGYAKKTGLGNNILSISGINLFTRESAEAFLRTVRELMDAAWPPEPTVREPKKAKVAEGE